jgi:hypothetical protein
MSDRGGDWTPRPDPTVLTTEALLREIQHLRERLEGEIKLLTLLDNEKFSFVDQRFRDLDVLIQQAFDNVKNATAAALASSKEAVDKSEVAVAKQIDVILDALRSQDKANDLQLADIKARLDKTEGKGMALTQLIVIGISVIAVIAAVVSVVLTAR